MIVVLYLLLHYLKKLYDFVKTDFNIVLVVCTYCSLLKLSPIRQTQFVLEHESIYTWNVFLRSANRRINLINFAQLYISIRKLLILSTHDKQCSFNLQHNSKILKKKN